MGGKRRLLLLLAAATLSLLVLGFFRFCHYGKQHGVEPQAAVLSVGHAEVSPDLPTFVEIRVLRHHPMGGEQGGFDVWLRNLGDTPAMNLSIVDHVLIEDANELLDAVNLSSYRPLLVGTLQPGATYTADVRFKSSAEGINSVATGRVSVVNLAQVTFEDAVHRKYTVRACDYWHGGMVESQPCQQPVTSD